MTKPSLGKPLFQGVCTALITPFTPKGIDLAALQKLVSWQIESGVSALVACGTTGEPSTMSFEEWALTVKTVADAARGRVPVIAGTGGNNTKEVIRMAREAKKLGASAQLCVTPYYNKTTASGLFAHYEAIAQEGSLPVIVYNVPSRTGLNLTPETLDAIAGLPGVVAVKEASANLIQVADMMRLCQNRIHFYSGSDEVIVPLMSLGGQGVISVVSNVAPELTVSLCEAMLKKDYFSAAQLQLKLMPLIHALFSEVNPIPAKAALSMMNRCQNILRLPLVKMSATGQQKLKDEMERLELI